MIEFRDVTKRYGDDAGGAVGTGGDAAEGGAVSAGAGDPGDAWRKGVEGSRTGKAALGGFSLRIENGTVCALIGPSGSGKSTAVRLVNRLLEPNSGTVLVDDTDVRAYDPSVLRLKLGYVIQSVGLFPHLRVWQNIAIVPRILGWGQHQQKKRADELLRAVELDPEEYRGKFPHQLSGGEAQRVGVARALGADPPYLLMDEPFGAVDPLTRVALQRTFRDLQRRLKKTVVLVTHDLDEAIALADTLAILKDGRLQQVGPSATVLCEPANQFVADFLGSERMLRLLATVPVRGFGARGRDGAPGSEVAPKGGDAAPGSSSEGRDDTAGRGEQVATLRDVLNYLLETGAETVPVVDTAGVQRDVGLRELRAWARP